MDDKMKKGISPILGAVLLIAFVVAIAGISSGFFSSFMQTKQSEIDDKGSNTVKCSTAFFEIDPDTINSEGNYTYLTVNIKGNSDIDELYATIYNDQRISEQDANAASTQGPYSPGDNVFLNVSTENITKPIARIDVTNPTCSGLSDSVENDTVEGWMKAELSNRF